MPHSQPVPDIPLWDRFTAECRRVIREFGLDPDDDDFQFSRSGEHRCQLIRNGTRGLQAEFALQLTGAHLFYDGSGGSFPCNPELQFNGRTSPLAIALQMALYPLVFDTVDRIETAHLIGEASMLFHTAAGTAAAGPIDLSHRGRR